MPVQLVIPKMSMSMTEGVLTTWLKPSGATVAAGELLYTVESEKTSMDVEAEAAGELIHVAAEGETLETGAVVGYVLGPGETPDAAAPAAPSADSSAPAAAPAAEPEPVRIAATPIARRLAKARRIDLATLTGSGPYGRIQERDVPEAAVGPSVIRHAAMRQTIAQRMHASLRDTAQFTIGADVAMDAVHAMRSAWAEADGPRPGYLDFVVAATARALRRHPRLNALFGADGIELIGRIDIGLAVALEEGLVAPVLRGADRLTLAAVSRETARLAAQARAGAIGGDAYAGATFTVSSLGGHGISWFTPILNPPQVGILGVGKLADGVAWEGESIRRRRAMPLSLTVDHRAVDGAPAAQFLTTVAELLAAPRRLLDQP